jgi:hypothetical protein
MAFLFCMKDLLVAFVMSVEHAVSDPYRSVVEDQELLPRLA